MAYWGRVAKRAWKDAREGANLATFEKMAILVFTQFLIGLLIYILLGETALHDQIWTRLATAAAPFGLLPILFLLRLPMTPPKLDREWEEWKAENEVKDKSGRWGLLYQIANLWRAETNDKSVAMQQGLAWVQTFPQEFYEHMFRLRGLEFSSTSVKRPQYFGHLTNDVVYKRLEPGVLKELKRVTPRNEAGRPTATYAQSLTKNIGYPKLKEHLGAVVAYMRISSSGPSSIHWELGLRAETFRPALYLSPFRVSDGHCHLHALR